MSRDSITSGTLIVALAIGKNVHWFGCYRYDGQLVELIPPQKVRSVTVGFAQFTATVDPLLAVGCFPAGLFGNEHTGVYHEPWAWLIAKHYQSASTPAIAPPWPPAWPTVWAIPPTC